jgi:hypothetical protein
LLAHLNRMDNEAYTDFNLLYKLKYVGYRKMIQNVFWLTKPVGIADPSPQLVIRAFYICDKNR